nr:pyridoxamine 5'-phosphate oxidase family protein [Nocardia huaxiensis]
MGVGHRAGRRVVELDWDESMRLLAAVPFGRVVFTQDALPAIRPVYHLIDEGQIIVVRNRLTARFTTVTDDRTNVVVAFEADDIDPVSHTGWSVVATGFARPVTDPDRIAHYERLLDPWVAGHLDSVIAIEPSIVTGLRLV